MRKCMVMLAMLAPACVSYAQDVRDVPVVEVRLEGLERASESLVSSQLEVESGKPFSRPAVARDLRRLYDLRLFSTIKVDASFENGDLIVTFIFEEKRRIDELRIIGNEKIKDRAIRKVLSWKEGDSFVPDAYTEERLAIQSLYSTKGFPNTTVDIIVDEVGPSRVRLTYLINENKKSRIKKIIFQGNKVLATKKLRGLMKTKPVRFFLGGRYDEEQFERDLQAIIDEYGNYGRLEADVTDTQFKYNKKGKKLKITIRVAEGPGYHVDTLELADNRVFDDDEIIGIIKVQPGDIHNRDQVAEDAELIRKGYEDSGYVDAEVVPLTTMNKENKTTHVVHQIREGSLKYIREIKITGNSATKDEIIRRSLLVQPGDRFDGSLIRASQRRLEATQYFSKVRLNLEDVEDDPGATDLLVDVEEGQTGSFNFGAGFSTEESFNAFFELRLNNFDITDWPNFTGAGQEFRFRASLGDVRSDFNLSFTDPEIGGHPFSFGFDLFSQSFSPRGSSFDQSTQGVQLRFAKSLSPFVSTRLTFRTASVNISDFAFSINPVLEDLEGGSLTNSLIWGITRNTTNHFRDPTSGAKHDLLIQLAGLGGDNDYYKIEHESTWYAAFGEQEKWVLSYTTREGIAKSYSSSTPQVPIQDRFFAGGASTVRGYNSRDIGPEIREFIFFGDEVSIGGELRLINNIELKYKISDLLRLYVFSDAGGVWANASDFNLGALRYSVGIGVGIDIPRLGPMRVDFGFPLNADSDQGSGKLHLTTGFRF